MKNLHSIRYYEKRLAKLERVADSIGYPIDDNADYIRATALLPLTVNEGGERGITIPAEFFMYYCAVCEAVEMARREAAKARIPGGYRSV